MVDILEPGHNEQLKSKVSGRITIIVEPYHIGKYWN